MKRSVHRGIPRPVIALGVLLLTGCTYCPPRLTEAPGSKEPAGPRGSEIFAKRPMNQPPPLSAPAHVAAFVVWAGGSVPAEHELAGKMIAEAGNNPEIAKAVIDEVERAATTNHSRALLAISILGEMKSAAAEPFLREFANRPLPKEGTVIEGEIIEATRQAQLQGKAADGLAYLRSQSGDSAVMELIARHPSKIVRAEAINAWLWNHGDSAEARRQLYEVVQQGERILLDRVRRVTGEGAESFNAKLAVFLKTHPELIPPAPEKAKEPVPPRGKGNGFDAAPPPF
jgi:hypothetical protein